MPLPAVIEQWGIGYRQSCYYNLSTTGIIATKRKSKEFYFTLPKQLN